MSEHFLRSLDDIREEQEAILEREHDPDMALISDYVIGELSEDKAMEVRARIEKDPDFRDLAEPLLLAYEHAPRLRRMPREDLERKWLDLRHRIGLPPIDAGATKPDPAIGQFRSDMAKQKRRNRRIAIWSLAAMLLLFITPPAVIRGYKSIKGFDRTPYGSTTVVPLADGSRATLSGGTRLSPSPGFGATNREVLLVGEASFEVATARGEPFVIHTGAAKIIVTGTAFNVHAFEYEPTQITVTRGTVSVRGRDADGNSFGPALDVGAGQRARVVRGFPPEIVP